MRAGLAPLQPRSATVGVELDVALRALGGGDVAFGYASDDLPDLTTRALKPTLTVFGGGQAMFRWTPLAGDEGEHQIHFTATAAGVVSGSTVTITVVAGADPIAFVEPVGDGTTLDLARASCADVQLLVEDTGAAQVDFSQGDTWADNAELDVSGPLSGALHFCPSAAQQQATSIFPFSVVAMDDSGALAVKRYTVVLGAVVTPPVQPSCGTTPPTITHNPHPNYTGTGNLHLNAEVTDPDGVYDATVFWSTSAPADPANPDVSAMTQLDMVQVGGTATDTMFTTTITNPNKGLPSGTRTTIYYLIRATDHDDQVAGCDFHTTNLPSGGVFSFTVTQP